MTRFLQRSRHTVFVQHLHGTSSAAIPIHQKKFRILFPCTYCLRFKALYTFKIDFVLFLRHALPRRLLLLASMHTDTTGYLSLGVSIGPRTQFGFASLRFFRTDRTLRAQPKKKFSLYLSRLLAFPSPPIPFLHFWFSHLHSVTLGRIVENIPALRDHFPSPLFQKVTPCFFSFSFDITSGWWGGETSNLFWLV